jgi:hypothetical protein
MTALSDPVHPQSAAKPTPNSMYHECLVDNLFIVFICYKGLCLILSIQGVVIWRQRYKKNTIVQSFLQGNVKKAL